MLFFDKIYDECKRLLEIINDILKLSFFDEGGEKLESSVVNVYEVAQRVVCSLAPLAAEKELRVQIICDDQASCTISAVARLLEDMLYNLCENAIKYNNQQGSLEICISTGEFDPRAIKDFTHITPSLALPIGQDTATIMIKDSGIGIPESEQKRVFERFYRVDKSRSKKLGGTGLGLSIVKHIAIYHNAHIFLRSNADLQSSDRGSEILVVFAR